MLVAVEHRREHLLHERGRRRLAEAVGVAVRCKPLAQPRDERAARAQLHDDVHLHVLAMCTLHVYRKVKSSVTIYSCRLVRPCTIAHDLILARTTSHGLARLPRLAVLEGLVDAHDVGVVEGALDVDLVVQLRAHLVSVATNRDGLESGLGSGLGL